MNSLSLIKLETLLPVRRKIDRLDPIEWRAAIEDLRRQMLSYTSSERLSFFTEAQDHLQEIGHHTTASIPYWFFAHPTAAVFEDFIANEDLCSAFADFLMLVSYGHGDGSGNRRYRRQLKRLMSETISEASQLVPRYIELLRTHDDGRFGYFKKPDKRNRKRLVLIPVPHTDTATQERMLEQERLLLNRELKKYFAELDHSSKQLGKIFEDVEQPTFPVDNLGLRAFAEDLFVSWEMFDFEAVLPGTWKNIRLIEREFRRILKLGTWPEFEAYPRTEVAVGPPKLVKCALSSEGVRYVKTTFLKNSKTLYAHMRTVHNGLLPVGLKIHCANAEASGMSFLQRGLFVAHNAGTCYNLPPVGSTAAATQMLRSIESRAGISYLGNPNFQIQVCSPGLLNRKHSALLGIAFYLGSDSLRRYRVGDFTTTHQNVTGDRLIIPGAGVLDTDFAWWNKTATGELDITQMPEGIQNRTDVLTCQSIRDIENVNLAASLLVHLQFGGYWEELGEQFAVDIEEMLRRHELAGLLTVNWMKVADVSGRDAEADVQFFEALDELATYAFAEADRINAAYARGDYTKARRGILFEIQSILSWYRSEIDARARVTGGES